MSHKPQNISVPGLPIHTEPPRKSQLDGQGRRVTPGARLTGRSARRAQARADRKRQQ